MNTELYQDLALKFFNPDHRNHGELAKGLIEEANEVKEAEDNETRQDLLQELGDVLWYVTIMANQEGSSLTQIMNMNYNKLELRNLNGK